ncbi:MAG: hypothetical protein II738_03470, partial [Clostridia bacterium]|nr:hypothetical protein [Clostridia bacterium]
MAADILSLAVAFLTAAVLKYGAVVFLDAWFIPNIPYVFLADLVITEGILLWRKTYSRMWQYFVYRDYGDLIVSVFTSQLITIVCFFYIWFSYTRDFLTYMALTGLLFLLLTLLVRGTVMMSYRLWRRRYLADAPLEGKKKNVMIIGAGGAANRLITELRGINYVNRFNIVALIDDNARKKGEYLD